MSKSFLVKTLRYSALLEGLSLLLLLFIAMPLKYMFDQPLMVEVVGMAHGVLFILYCVVLLGVGVKFKWLGMPLVLSFIASFIPFGTFYVDSKYFKKLNTAQ